MRSIGDRAYVIVNPAKIFAMIGVPLFPNAMKTAGISIFNCLALSLRFFNIYHPPGLHKKHTIFSNRLINPKSYFSKILPTFQIPVYNYQYHNSISNKINKLNLPIICLYIISEGQ